MKVIGIVLVFVVCLVFVACSEEIQPLKSLQKGMPNTITLSTGNVVYDITGEWETILDNGAYGTFEDILNITQEGNKFVGILSIGNSSLDKGSELIKGELEKNGFKFIQRITTVAGAGWMSSNGKIDEGGNKIVVKTKLRGDASAGTTLVVTLTRK